MSNARIIEIPATRQIRSGKNNTMRKMRVAAYCRVSTEEEEQQGSFETQKLYYTEKINSTSEWELAGIYADDGISGIHTKKRDGFNQMIQDCKKKKIDLILTKSISRFARNTLDSIQYVRMLKAIGIAVIFEKENINTSTMNSEMILTVLSAFAQAESESISQNVARGKRMGFRQGKFPFPYGQILGYRKGLDGKPEVIPEEAEVIRMIFNSYLQGASLLTIKKKLEAGGVLTARGNKKWSSESVQRILQNEKYCSVRCRLKSPAAIVSRQLTNANDTKAAITANMPYPNDWSAETVAALISGLLGTSTAENKSFGDASIDSNTEQNFAVIHRQSRKKNCIRLF